MWTINRPEDMELASELGIDVAITDHPAELLRRLGRTAV